MTLEHDDDITIMRDLMGNLLPRIVIEWSLNFYSAMAQFTFVRSDDCDRMLACESTIVDESDALPIENEWNSFWKSLDCAQSWTKN